MLKYILIAHTKLHYTPTLTINSIIHSYMQTHSHTVIWAQAQTDYHAHNNVKLKFIQTNDAHKVYSWYDRLYNNLYLLQ